MSDPQVVKCVTRYAGLTPRRDLRNHTLIFTHIPKTGGTTLDYILRDVAKAQNIPVGRAMGTIYGQFHGVGKEDAIKDADRWPDKAFATRCYMSGHVPFGLHKRMQHPYFYITLLRDPVKRLLSQYRFGIHRNGWTASMPIAKAIEQGLIADDLQTRQIAGQADRSAPCTAETLRTAVGHLRSEYAVVGVSERFDEMLKTLITLLGWPDIAYGNRQVGAGAASAEMVEESHAAAQRFFAHDIELYAQARQLAEENVTRLFDGSPGNSQRQAQVITSVPGLQIAGKNTACVLAFDFDHQVAPALRQSGSEIKFI